jgi:hypothetical protein
MGCNVTCVGQNPKWFYLWKGRTAKGFCPTICVREIATDASPHSKLWATSPAVVMPQIECQEDKPPDLL